MVRFPLSQGDKIRMIDDYSVLGVNDSCTIHSKLDLHVVDTFAATAKSYFRAAGDCKKSLAMVAKTYDLKAAYRQVPVHKDRLKQAYFAIFNHVIGSSEIYRSRCLPCGATHSVYSFLRLAKMLHCVACRGAKLITTNFYDDFILASAEDLQDPARNCMELVFLFTGWDFAREGKKVMALQPFSGAFVLPLQPSLVLGALRAAGCQSRVQHPGALASAEKHATRFGSVKHDGS
ncbi:unnamed protein product [Effrenium voratum]|nr:unnamed protein product [Effrenium voratum]